MHCASPSSARPLARRCGSRRRGWFALAACLLLAGCSSRGSTLDHRQRDFQGQRFQVVQINLKRHELGLHWRNPQTGEAFGSIDNLRQWGQAHGQRLLFAANAGIYDRNFAPLGLHVENGRTLVPLNMAHGDPAAGNFSLRPNGVFAIYPNGTAAVLTSGQFKAQQKPVQVATQSGPMLVIDGRINASFDEGSTSMKWRSGVCARTPTEVVFAVSETPVNFHTFASLFRDALGCQNALYLDGSISQFYIDGVGYAGAPGFTLKPYAGIFAVFAR